MTAGKETKPGDCITVNGRLMQVVEVLAGGCYVLDKPKPEEAEPKPEEAEPEPEEAEKPKAAAKKKNPEK